MDKESLQKKTVSDLKDMARQIPNVKGLSSMKKDEIIDVLLEQGDGGKTTAGPAKEVKKPAPAKRSGELDKGEIKQMIRTLKEEKKEAISSQDRARVKQCNRRIHEYKRRLRKMAGGKKRR